MINVENAKVGKNWGEVLQEIGGIEQECRQAIDIANRRMKNAAAEVRHRYLKNLHEYLQHRNIIAYYSGFLSKNADSSICDEDKNGFMMAVHRMDKKKGLDLILHTEGGSIAATESLVDYLRKMFGKDIRAIIPQIAMSAGTMIACSCKEIWMGKDRRINNWQNSCAIAGRMADRKGPDGVSGMW